MDTLINLFANNPSVAVLMAALIGAITLVIFFVVKDYTSREEQFKGFESRLNIALNEFKNSAADYEESLKKESERISKEIKRPEYLVALHRLYHPLPLEYLEHPVTPAYHLDPLHDLRLVCCRQNR